MKPLPAPAHRCTGPLLAYTGALGFLDAGIRWAAPSLLQRCTAPWDRPVGEGGQTSGYAWLWQPPFHQHDLVDQKWRCRGFWVSFFSDPPIFIQRGIQAGCALRIGNHLAQQTQDVMPFLFVPCMLLHSTTLQPSPTCESTAKH